MRNGKEFFHRMISSEVIAELVILILLIALSAWFSSAETAYSTVSEVSLRARADEKDRRAARALEVLDQYSKMLSTILICNNIVNLSASALCTSLIIRLFGVTLVGIGTAALTIVVILFGEITPKNISRIRAEQIAVADAPVIRFLMTVLTPVIAVIQFLADALMRLFRVDPDEKKTLTERELRTYVEVGREDGVIEGREKKMIYNVFDFGDSEAQEIMIPRIDMTCISAAADYDEVLRIFRTDMFTRIPVYDTDPDHIIGHINIKDFILLNPDEPFYVRDLLRRPYYTYEYKKTADLLREMQKLGVHVAFVLNEYGDTVGMITLEDLVEELIGEIRDEYDEDERKLIHRYDDYTYLVDGSMKIDDINDALGTDFSSEDYDSIGGLFLEKLERLPRSEEIITLPGGTTLQAKGIRKNRIVKVLIRFPHLAEGEDSPEAEGAAPSETPADAYEESAFSDAVQSREDPI